MGGAFVGVTNDPTHGFTAMNLSPDALAMSSKSNTASVVRFAATSATSDTLRASISNMAS